MLNKFVTLSFIASLSIFLAACDKSDIEEAKKVTVSNEVKQVTSTNTSNTQRRWYSTAQVLRGKKVFKDNCAVCHGERAQGLVKDWQKPLPDGKYPAPPLNGTAHAWHHSKDLLLRTVNNGGIALGGTMPPFKDKLTQAEKEAVIAYVSSLWPDNIYDTWAKRNPPK